MIDRLERGGFVRRGRDAADRRQVIIEASPEPRDEITAAVEPARRHLQAVLQRYTAPEVRVLVDYFTHAAPALLAAVDDLRDRSATSR
jgi:DNA-binding MarR family transcriptional regulator